MTAEPRHRPRSPLVALWAAVTAIGMTAAALVIDHRNDVRYRVEHANAGGGVRYNGDWIIPVPHDRQWTLIAAVAAALILVVVAVWFSVPRAPR